MFFLDIFLTGLLIFIIAILGLVTAGIILACVICLMAGVAKRFLYGVRSVITGRP